MPAPYMGTPGMMGARHLLGLGPLSPCSFALLTGTRQATLVTSLAISATNEARFEDCNEMMTQTDSYQTPKRSSVPKKRQNGSVDHKKSRSLAPQNQRCSDKTKYKHYEDSQRELRQQGISCQNGPWQIPVFCNQQMQKFLEKKKQKTGQF